MSTPKHLHASHFPQFLLGGDYYPEQWRELGDAGIWSEDLRLMKAAGVNIVTLGVFSWVSLEPAEGTFTFVWLDAVMESLQANNIQVCLATGTAAQPAWLSAKYPEVLPVNIDGQRQEHGGRMNFCPTNADFRRLSQAHVQRLAERYATHPALALWHISNEYGPSCYCEGCAAHFRLWLRARYVTLGSLNDAWGTTFWGHTYTDWEQIAPPRTRGEQSIQALIIDYQRFISDMNLECYRGEAARLRAITPQVPITTNFHGPNTQLDYFAWAPYQDVITWDAYPQATDHPSTVAWQFDLMRSLREGQSWLLMEQTPSQVQWRTHNPLKRPGEMRQQSYQAIAHGADGVMFFQWRQSRNAAEMYHGAVVSHAGTEHSRVFQEVAALGHELQRLEHDLVAAPMSARVALMFSWENWWALNYRPRPSESLNYLTEIQQYYQVLWEHNVLVDIIPPDANLSRYDLIIAPVLNVVSAEQGAAIERFVADGGTFLTTFFSGVVNLHHRAWLGGYPGPLRRTLGIWVEEFDPLQPNMSNTLICPDWGMLPAGSYACDLWCDLIHLEGATPLATFGEDFYAGRPAITAHQFGLGRAYYIATRPSHALLDAVMQCALDDQMIKPPLLAPPGVEVTQRHGERQAYTFLLNHGSGAQTIALPEAMVDLLTGNLHAHEIVLARYGVAILVPAP